MSKVGVQEQWQFWRVLSGNSRDMRCNGIVEKKRFNEWSMLLLITHPFDLISTSLDARNTEEINFQILCQ